MPKNTNAGTQKRRTTRPPKHLTCNLLRLQSPAATPQRQSRAVLGGRRAKQTQCTYTICHEHCCEPHVKPASYPAAALSRHVFPSVRLTLHHIPQNLARKQYISLNLHYLASLFAFTSPCMAVAQTANNRAQTPRMYSFSGASAWDIPGCMGCPKRHRYIATPFTRMNKQLGTNRCV